MEQCFPMSKSKICLASAGCRGRAGGGNGLRTPTEGTLEDVLKRHEDFTKRLGPDGFTPPPPLSAYVKTEYRRAIDPPTRPVAAFSLLQLDASRFRAFDPARRGLTLAGMMRSAVKVAASPERLAGIEDRFVCPWARRGEDRWRTCRSWTAAFRVFPLPSLETRNQRRVSVVGSVRRVIVSTFASEFEEEIAWARRNISGQELRDEDSKRPVALLSLIPENEKGVQCYTRAASTWATVTPVVLPGYDDPKHYRRRLQHETVATEQRELLERLGLRIDGLLLKRLFKPGFQKNLRLTRKLNAARSAFGPAPSWPTGTEYLITSSDFPGFT